MYARKIIYLVVMQPGADFDESSAETVSPARNLNRKKEKKKKKEKTTKLYKIKKAPPYGRGLIRGQASAEGDKK